MLTKKKEEKLKKNENMIWMMMIREFKEVVEGIKEKKATIKDGVNNEIIKKLIEIL